MIRLDMSEYMERHSVARPTGAPPGYVGYEEGPAIEAVRRRSYAVILLDEIEGPSRGLQRPAPDHGRRSLTGPKASTVDFRNTIIIMSGNVGAQMIKREAQIGFLQRGADERSGAAGLRPDAGEGPRRVKNVFRPEFLNRVDMIVVFRALAQADVLNIVDIELCGSRSSSWRRT